MLTELSRDDSLLISPGRPIVVIATDVAIYLCLGILSLCLNFISLPNKEIYDFAHYQSCRTLILNLSQVLFILATTKRSFKLKQFSAFTI